jgi:hypothetical protein
MQNEWQNVSGFCFELGSCGKGEIVGSENGQSNLYVYMKMGQ